MRLTDSSATRNSKRWRAPLILIAGTVAGLAIGLRFFAQDPAAGTDGTSTSPLPVSGQVFILPTATGESAILPALAPGNPAPNFTLKTLDGGQVTLAEYRGGPVLINFWATWCTPCRSEMPELVRSYQQHKDPGLPVLAIRRIQIGVMTADQIREFTAEILG